MQHLIETHLAARTPGLCLLTTEELRALQCIHAACAARDYKLFVWSPLAGINEVQFVDKQMQSTPRAAASAKGQSTPPWMLATLLSDQIPEKSVLVAPDFHLVELRRMDLVRMLKDTLWQLKGKQQKTLITLGAQMKLPPELEKEFWVLDFTLPNRQELLTVVQGVAESIGQSLNGNTDPLVDAVSGLTWAEAEQACAISVAETKLKDGTMRLEPDIIQREKASTVKKNGILELLDPGVRLEDIGGLELLKSWLIKRRMAYTKEAREAKLPTPKGVLCIGLPGAGKSLAAKASASVLGVPLLRLDAGKLFGSLVGQSESNLRSAIQTAEAIAPCILFMDEIEKGLSGIKSSGHTDGGTSARVFGTFLQWMQDKTAPVFVFATANNISALPPELLRKGRWDDLFFVDLPSPVEREAIFSIHLRKFDKDPDALRADVLSMRCEGYSGAEIEAAIHEALFDAFAEGRPLTRQHIEAALAASVPLSKTMKDELEALRTWASGRARRASEETQHSTISSGRSFSE